MSDDAPSDQHWCYHCNKRVVVETLQGESFVVCSECNKGFVESIQPTPRSPPLSPDLRVEDSSIGSHFLQMLRLLTHAPSPPRLDVLSYEDEFFGLEINSRNEIDDDDEEEEEEEEDDEEEEEEEDLGGEMFPITTRSITGRNRILDWAEILMGIEDNSGGNAGDYVDEGAGYEALLQNLAEGDGGGRRGAPPAAKSAIEALETFEVCSSDDDKMMMVVVICAVCKDGMVIGETVKKLPCGHCYHGNCILPWLGTRNSCPVCRFQLKTDDAEYEEERKKRTTINTTALADSSAAASSST